VSYSEGVTGHSPLRTRRPQRAFLGTAVYSVSRRLISVISNFPSWCNPPDTDSSYTIPVLPRMYRSAIFQAGVTPRIRRFGCGQGAPDQPHSLLLYKDEESAKSSQFSAHQLTILEREQEYNVNWFWDCQVCGGCTTTAMCPMSTLKAWFAYLLHSLCLHLNTGLNFKLHRICHRGKTKWLE